MHFWLIYPIISRCAAASLFKQDSSRTSLKTLQPDSVDQSHFLPDQARFTPSSKDDVHLIRVREIQQNRQGYLYDPSLLGITSYFPTGLLGDAMVKPHIVSWLRDAAWVDHAAVEEASAAAAAAKERAGPRVSDYQIMYGYHWKTSNPSRLAQGSLLNSILREALQVVVRETFSNGYNLQRRVMIGFGPVQILSLTLMWERKLRRVA